MSGKKVLIVEDDPTIACNLGTTLNNLGYTVLPPVSTGIEAISRANEWMPDIILMDIELDDQVTGIDAARKINEFSDHPVIYIVAHSTMENVAKAQGPNIYGFLTKPVQTGELAASIRMALYKHEMDRKLRESETKYRSIVENTNDAVYIHELDGTIVDVNENVCRMVGYTREEMIGANLAKIDKGWRIPKNEDLERLLQAGRSVFERENIHRDGSIIPIEVSVILLEREGKGICQAFVRDITERKRAAEALQQSEQRYRAIFENAADSIVVIDLETGKNLEFNPIAYENLGYREDEFAQLNFDEIETLSPGQKFSIFQKLRRNGHIKFETRHLTKWGTLRDMIINVVTIPYKGKIAALGIGHDITERKQTEKALIESEELFRGFAEDIPCFICSFLSDTTLTYVNPAFAAMAGIPPNQLIGRRFFDLVSPEVKEGMIRQLESLTPENPVEFHEHMYPDSDGIKRYQAWSNRAFFDDNEKPIRFIGVGFDITGRKETEEVLRRSNRQLKLLNGITRHDIRNKINVILGYLSLAEMESKDPQIMNYFSSIESATKEIKAQIEFTKTYENLGSQEPKWQDLAIIKAISPHLATKIRIDADIPHIEIYADPMLEKVYLNLFENSIRHGKSVTEIRVSTQESDKGLKIMFEDNGVGIPTNEKDQIFERGFGKNTGLGLFLVREILSLTDISIRETGIPGEGARFEITVPKGMYRTLGNV